MTWTHLRFDFNLVKGLVTHLVGLSSILWSFSPNGCEELCLTFPWLKVLSTSRGASRLTCWVHPLMVSGVNVSCTWLKVFTNSVVAVRFLELEPWTMVIVDAASEQTKGVPWVLCTKGEPWVSEVWVPRTDLGFLISLYYCIDNKLGIEKIVKGRPCVPWVLVEMGLSTRKGLSRVNLGFLEP